MRAAVIFAGIRTLYRRFPGARQICRAGFGAVAFLSAITAAHAQQVVPNSGPPQPREGTQIERRIQQQPPPTRLPPPPVVRPGAVPPAISGTFILSAVVIDGATVFDTAAFVPLYRDLLARPVTQRDLAGLTEAITDMYDKAGYSLTRAYVPPQDIESGVVHIRVAEGYIERVTIPGDLGQAAVIGRYTAPITAERPLTRATLERQLLLLADLFEVRVDDARLRPIAPEEGRYELILDLRQKTYDTYSYLDNRGTRANGPFELWTSAGVNVTGDGSWRAQAGVFTVPDSPRELLYGQVGLAHVLGAAGTVVQATVSASHNVAGPPLQQDDLQTGSRRLLLGLTHPILRSRPQSLWASLYVDALKSTESEFGHTTFDDQLRVLRASLYYYVADAWQGENGINVEGSYGLSALGASSSGSNRSEPGVGASFRKLRFDLWRSQALVGRWSLYGQFAGQLSDRPLLLSEQFSLGGARFGRGYDPAIIAGDRGAAGSLELRYTQPLQGTVTELQPYAFYDAGGISSGSSDTNARHRLESAGFGGRLTVAPAVHLALELAKPLNGVPGHPDGSWRAFFFASAGF